MPSHTSQARVRLGEMLVRRRIELDPRYRNRRTFVDERAPKLYRIVNDAEVGRRSNFEPGTIAALEDAYNLQPGSYERALDDGDLEPAAVRPSVAPDPFEQSRPAGWPGTMITPEMVAAADAEFMPAIKERISALAGRGNTSPSGEDVFGDDMPAAWAYDAVRSMGGEPAEAAWSVALQKARATQAERRGRRGA